MAEDGDSGIDLMGAGECGATAAARFSFATVDREFQLKGTRLPRPGAIVPNGGPTGGNGGSEDADNFPVEPPVIIEGELPGFLRGIDAGQEQGLVGVDVPDPREVALIHDHLLDRSPRASYHFGKSLGREGRIERFGPDGG
jgi:hypothetical protein